MKNTSYHFIGIGGIGMSGIAQILLRRGIAVSGSDIKESAITGQLKELGAQVFIGHAAANIEGAEVVVYSSAIPPDNPEIIAARNKRLPLLQRAQALAGLMEEKTGITVSGSHGKTTITSLAAQLLLEAGLMPSVAIGGILKNIDSNASLGQGEYFIAEADESDGSFLHYQPHYSIITNIDHEHLDHYKDFNGLLAAFAAFAGRSKEPGCLFACSDDKHLKKILAGYKKKRVWFGIGEGAEIYPKKMQMRGLGSSFECYFKGSFIAEFSLSIGGVHNISNSLAVIALGLELGVSLPVIKRSLAGFRGAGRRMEVKFENTDYRVIDDYAHHPTEIKATLEALKYLKPRRIMAVFQPHRYSRSKLLLEDFAASFDNADYIVVTDIYPAGEPPIGGIDAGLIYAKLKNNYPAKQVCYLPKEEIAGHILSVIKPGDLIVTLGAGDIARNNDELVEKIKRQSQARGAA